MYYVGTVISLAILKRLNVISLNDAKQNDPFMFRIPRVERLFSDSVISLMQKGVKWTLACCLRF